MKKSISALSLLLQLSLQDKALACPEGHHPGRNPIEALDANNDKQLSADEVKDAPFLVDKFSEIDTDKNGLLSQDELEAHRKAHKPDRPRPSKDQGAE